LSCLGVEEEEDAGLDDDGNEVAAGPSKRRKENNKINPTFMEGVGGVTAVTDQPRLADIQRKAQDFCAWEK